MPPKKPVNKFDFEAFRKSLETENQPARRIGVVLERKYFLIVTEGEKTEPNYFKGIMDLLPPELVEVKIVGEGKNTIQVVQRAIDLRNQRKNSLGLPNYDEVWAVFDKDDFPEKKFNGAIELAHKENIKPAYSNEAFELWFVLHFQNLHAAVPRSQYIEILEKILERYSKNDPLIYKTLNERGDEKRAIKWAKTLLKKFQGVNPAKSNPTTKVHELVISLNKFKKR